MFIVMGATGHIGSVVANILLDRREAVAVLTRKPDEAGAWEAKGARVIEADADDADSLRQAFRQGRRAFLLNPPADPTSDTDTVELRTGANIVAALKGSALEKVVAASTYGARPGARIGDLTTLWAFEEALRAQPIPAAINRGAYYMTNWLALADTVRQSGKLPSMFPVDTVMPMVAPQDLGEAAVTRLLSGVDDTAVRHVEGPARYTPQDVADAFASALKREVTVEVAPRDRWRAIYKEVGFSDEAARSYVAMIRTSLDEGFDSTDADDRGRIELRKFISDALASNG